ncbi:hypothetical protein BS17DRAFT_779947 [Gyrodon lividus]|nr:hypothetical protein BS17DRAFT_779947 [Gyrodon lividus]
MAVGTDVVWARIKAELHAIVARDDLDNDLSALIAIIGAVLIAAGVIMVLPAAGLGIACIAGFSAVGPVAGTLAAWIQSTFYGAFTCGLFSIAQSVTMSASTWPVPLLLGGIAAFGLGYVLRYYVAPLFRDHPHQE